MFYSIEMSESFPRRTGGKNTINRNTTLPPSRNLNRVLSEYEARMATNALQQRTDRAKFVFTFSFDNGNLQTTVH